MTKDEALKMRKEQDEYWSKIIKQAEYWSKIIKKAEEALEQPAQVTRLEVIDNNGRSYVNWGVDKLEFSYQDDGRTLKIFTNGTGAKPSWQGLSDDEIRHCLNALTLDRVQFARAIEQVLRNKNENNHSR